MASQDRSYKYIGSLTEGPSLTSGCGMACCPWTAYACKERTALRRVWLCHTLCIPISISLVSLVCHKNKTGKQETEHLQLELSCIITLLNWISSVRSEHVFPQTVETFGLKCKSEQMFFCYLPDHLQRWQGSLRVWVCMGWSLPLVETTTNRQFRFSNS